MNAAADELASLQRDFPQDMRWAQEAAEAMRDTAHELDAWPWPPQEAQQ